MEEKLVSSALKGDQAPNEEDHLPGTKKVLENTWAKLRNEELSSRATNGGLKQLPNRVHTKAELASTKGDDKSKRITGKRSCGDRQAKGLTNIILNAKTRGEREARQGHEGTPEQNPRSGKMSKA